MEYRGYTPEEVKKDKRKNMFFIILLMIPLLLGLFLLVGTIQQMISIKVEDISTISYTSIESGETYYFDEMVVVDAHSYYGNSTIGYAERTHYLVSFVDRDGTRVYTSLTLEGVSDIGEQCEAYIEDENLKMGDMILTGCFHGYDNGSTIGGYFEEAYEIYNAEEPGEMLNWSFFYDDVETKEEYLQKERSGKGMTFGIAAVFVIPCALGIWLLLRQRKELNEYLLEYNNEINYY